MVSGYNRVASSHNGVRISVASGDMCHRFYFVAHVTEAGSHKDELSPVGHTTAAKSMR